jgi:hypothetical protein
LTIYCFDFDTSNINAIRENQAIVTYMSSNSRRKPASCICRSTTFSSTYLSTAQLTFALLSMSRIFTLNLLAQKYALWPSGESYRPYTIPKFAMALTNRELLHKQSHIKFNDHLQISSSNAKQSLRSGSK